MGWKALHLFIHDISFHNVFLVEYLKPEIERMEQTSLLKQFFYISYWQGGNHIRFRYKSHRPKQVEAEVKACFASFQSCYKPVYVLSKTAYYELYSDNKEQVEDLTWVNDRTVQAMEYEPEFQRYGGSSCMVHNEALFSISSRYALQIRKDAGSNMLHRIIGALDMFTIALRCLQDPMDFLTRYRTYWAEFAPSKSRIVMSATELSEKYKERYKKLIQNGYVFYSEWEKALQKEMKEICRIQITYFDAESARAMILSSQIHMTNNRLGVFPQMEAFLAEVLCLCGGD